MQTSQSEFDDKVALKITNLQSTVRRVKIELLSKHLNKIMSREINIPTPIGPAKIAWDKRLKDPKTDKKLIKDILIA